MRRFVSRLAPGLVFFAALGATVVHAQDATRGRELYMSFMCSSCHGSVGQGGERGSGPRLAPNPWPYEAFAMQVRRPRDQMPPYRAAHVPDRDLRDIHAYLASVRGGPAAKDIRLLAE